MVVDQNKKILSLKPKQMQERQERQERQEQLSLKLKQMQEKENETTIQNITISPYTLDKSLNSNYVTI